MQAPHAAHPRGPLLAHHPCPPGLPQLEGQRGDAGRGGQLFHAVPAADGRYRPAPSPWGPLLSSLPQNEGKELITEPLQGLSQTRAACLCVALGPGSAATFQPARSQWVLASAPPFFLVPTSLGVQAQGPGRSRRLPASPAEHGCSACCRLCVLPPFLVEEGDISSTPWDFRQRGFSTSSPQALQAAWIAVNTALVLLANSPGARWFPLSLRPNRAKALLTLGPGLAGQCGVEGLDRASCFQESLPVGVKCEP